MQIKDIRLIHKAVILLLFGSLILGIAHIAMLPPWEGFDETAHYSYLQQISDTRKLPRQGVARISVDVENYAVFAPMPYSSIPPMDQNGGFTYKSFFNSSGSIIDNARDYVHNRPDEARRYKEGEAVNWQSQHPPLFYLLLSPVYAMTKHLSWSGQLFILRLVSYLFAWLALVLVVYGCKRATRADATADNKKIFYSMMLGAAAWPVLFPSWYPEMARLGNDSLCALIAALIWFFAAKAFKERLTLKYSIVFGLLLGLGSLTKAFFVPVTAGFIAFMCVHQWYFDGGIAVRRLAINLAAVLIPIFFISGWWYFANYYQHGVVLGSAEMIELHNKGGLLTNLLANFSLKAWIRGHAAFATTLGWSSTWSLARPPYVYLAPVASIVVFTAITYAVSLRRYEYTSMAWFPAWLAVPVLIGFSYHVLVRIALTGEGKGTGGYYLHFLAALLGAALGSGFGTFWAKRVFRKIVVIMFSYTFIFYIVITWAQLLLFSGIMFKAGSNKFYQMPDVMPAMAGLPEAINRLKTIAFPNAAIITFAIGATVILAGLIYAYKGAEMLADDN